MQVLLATELVHADVLSGIVTYDAQEACSIEELECARSLCFDFLMPFNHLRIKSTPILFGIPGSFSIVRQMEEVEALLDV